MQQVQTLHSYIVLLCVPNFRFFSPVAFSFFFFYCFLFLIMYSACTTGCQFNFIGPFKGQINLCFYKEKIKDQLSWPSMYVCYLSLQSSQASLEEILSFCIRLPYSLVYCFDGITHLPVDTLALNEQSYFTRWHCLIYGLRSHLEQATCGRECSMPVK